MEALATKTYPLRILVSSEEKDLVRLCLKGDQKAQYRLYKKYVKAMYHTISRMVGNAMDAEDLTQDVFAKVFKNLKSFKGDSTLGAWIKKITVNTALNFLKSRGRMHFVDMEDNFVEKEEDREKEAPQWSMKEIHEAIKKLPSGSRAVFNLFLLEGYQHKEIAEILNITESTSKTQYRRAKKLLRETLK